MARLYQKINNEAVPLGGGGGGSVAIDNDTITENSDGEIQVATTLTSKINQLNNVAADMGKVLTANGNGTAEWDDILVPIDYETITKNSDGELQVSSMPYDNTESGLTADNVQDAIDEVNGKIVLNDYSTTRETVIGSFDGKPLYRKMVSFTLVTNKDRTLFSVPELNIERVVKTYGFVYQNDGWILQVPSLDSNTTYNVGCSTGPQDGVYKVCVIYGTGIQSKLVRAEIFIEYTKTTD